jgi:hypothetical protein
MKWLQTDNTADDTSYRLVASTIAAWEESWHKLENLVPIDSSYTHVDIDTGMTVAPHSAAVAAAAAAVADEDYPADPSIYVQ